MRTVHRLAGLLALVLLSACSPQTRSAQSSAGTPTPAPTEVVVQLSQAPSGPSQSNGPGSGGGGGAPRTTSRPPTPGPTTAGPPSVSLNVDVVVDPVSRAFLDDLCTLSGQTINRTFTLRASVSASVATSLQYRWLGFGSPVTRGAFLPATHWTEVVPLIVTVPGAFDATITFDILSPRQLQLFFHLRRTCKF